jgi:hypothetical protein
MDSLRAVWLFFVTPRYSPLAFCVFVLIPVWILYWWLGATCLESSLPEIRVEPVNSTGTQEAYQQDYSFTTDWFSKHIPVWEQVFAAYVGKSELEYLEVGVYEGMSALWMLDNVLTSDTAHLTGIDPFLGDYEQRFRENLELSGASEKATVIRGFSQLVLRDLTPDSYDIIYIDGSHATKDVLEDAVLCWRLLRKGGILIFDDYLWVGLGFHCEFDSAADYPKPAIDAFATCFKDEIEVMHNSSQLIIRKKEL